MDVVKHKCYEYTDDDNHYGCSYIGLIEKQNYSKDKKNHSHQSASKSIKSISDIYGIDDGDSDEESYDRIK